MPWEGGVFSLCVARSHLVTAPNYLSTVSCLEQDKDLQGLTVYITFFVVGSASNLGTGEPSAKRAPFLTVVYHTSGEHRILKNTRGIPLTSFVLLKGIR